MFFEGEERPQWAWPSKMAIVFETCIKAGKNELIIGEITINCVLL
jgi:hypothetical protein